MYVIQNSHYDFLIKTLVRDVTSWDTGYTIIAVKMKAGITPELVEANSVTETTEILKNRQDLF